MSFRRRSRPLRRSLAALLVLSSFLPQLALAQAPEVRGALVEVRVEGSEVYADIVRTLVSARTGTPAERIDLEAERNRVYGLGTFASVSVSLLDEAAGPVLRIVVEENPEIGEVVFAGVESLSASALRELVAREHLVAAGRIFNSGRADEAAATLADVYRAEGFPFRPTVTLETERAPELAERGEEAPLRVRYRVDESAPIDEVTFGPSEVFDEQELRDLFAAVADQDAFDLALYRVAVRALADRYAGLGYRQSGVDLEGTTLRGGVLDVRLRELRIEAIDTTPLGIDADRLTLEPGDLFDYDALLADVRRLAEGRSGDVRLVPLVGSAGGVRVTFELGPPDTAGAIEEIVIEGNTVLDDATLIEALSLRPGDTFTSTLAEEDFRRISEAYADAGFVLANRPDYNWLDGTYVQRLVEFRVGAYTVSWRGGEPDTEEFVILRELPDVGSVLSLRRLDEGLRSVLAGGAVRPVDRQLRPLEGGEPDELLVEIVVEPSSTGLFQPAATYSTLDGFSASLGLSERNLWGRAHAIEAEVDARTSDIGFLFGGSVRYSIPWLYVEQGDFQEVPTSLSLSLFSNVSSNQPLSDDGALRVELPGSAGGSANEVAIGEYTRRDSGFAIAAGRPVAEGLDLRLRARASLSDITLEPPTGACALDGSGDVIDPDACSLPREQAQEYLPLAGASGFLGASLAYDARDAAEYPREGVAASASIGVGIGNDFLLDGARARYAYVPVEAGVKGYVTLEQLTEGEIADDGHVLAARLNIGHQFGGAYPPSRFFLVGQTPNEATQIRGYRDDDFDLSRSYATASFEYRYDFRLTTVATQTIIGIVFADVGWASGVPGYEPYQAPVFASGGLGVQVNLGFSGVALPALRFDYGFSERNPRGVFSFRIGTVF